MSQNNSDYMLRDEPKEPPLEEVRGDNRFHIGYYGKHIRARADLTRDRDSDVIIPDEVSDEEEYKAGNSVRS